MRNKFHIISVAPLLPLIDLADRTQISMTRLMQDMDLPESLFDQPSHFIPTKNAGLLMNSVSQKLDSPLIGFSPGFSRLSSLGVVEMPIRISSTLGEALVVLVKNISAHETGSTLRIIELANSIMLLYSTSPTVREGRAPIHDAALGIMLTIIRSALGKDWQPKTVYVAPHSSKVDYDEVGLHRSRIVVSETFTGLELPKTTLLSSMPKIRAEWCGSVGSATADQQFGEIGAFIRSLLGEKDLNIDYIAKKTGISTRSLQRAFQAQGTSFRSWVYSQRMLQAEELIQNQGISLTEATYLLGYDHVSNFSRALRVWRSRADLR